MFEIDDDDYLQIKQEDVEGEAIEPVRRAVAACPRQAISLVEDPAD